MTRKRDWAAEVEGTEIKFVAKDGDYIVCTKDGFQFRVDRRNWPPRRLSADSCLTPNEFFKYQVEKVHNGRYDLSVTEYRGADNLVEAICPEHGMFSIEAKYLKSFRGCQLCGYARAGASSRGNTDDFVSKAKKVHGERYDYSLVNYSTCKENIKIICKIHGEFECVPNNHLQGKGCRLCGYQASIKSRVLSQQEVIERFTEKHHERYDYSLVEYEGDAHQHLKIVCKDHGEFMQSYANHFHGGKGCPDCAKEFSPRLKRGFLKSYQAKNYASLYLLSCSGNGEQFYKIGITTKDIKSRFSGEESMPYDYELLHLLVSDGDSVWELEKTLHREYFHVKYLPKLAFGGMYECFSEIDFEEYCKILSIIG